MRNVTGRIVQQERSYNEQYLTLKNEKINRNHYILGQRVQFFLENYTEELTT